MIAKLTGRRGSKDKPTRNGEAAPETSKLGKKKRRNLQLSAGERKKVPALIEPFRYAAHSDLEWQSSPPQGWQPKFSIRVVDHSEAEGRTLYQVKCALSEPGEMAPFLVWGVRRRLEHLRKGLHDVVKREMGPAYVGVFKGFPFAHRGGVKGTTSRLDAWCGRFAACIDAGMTTPAVLAQALKLLDAPRVDGWRLAKKEAAEGAMSASTTDVELADAESDCESYESDFESDSEDDESDRESSTEDDAEVDGSDLQGDGGPVGASSSPGGGFASRADSNPPDDEDLGNRADNLDSLDELMRSVGLSARGPQRAGSGWQAV